MKHGTKKVARIFLIDDHPAVRQGLKLLLEQESHIICGEADCRAGTFEKIGASGADVAFLDLSLGAESGLDLIAGIHNLGIAVLVYSMHSDADTIESAFAAGASGYVTKREATDALHTAVADLLSGKHHISPQAAQSLAGRILPHAKVKSEALLSDREQQILSMLAQGESNTEIASVFANSVRTIETHFSRIIAKLRLGGMKELRRYAAKSSF